VWKGRRDEQVKPSSLLGCVYLTGEDQMAGEMITLLIRVFGRVEVCLLIAAVDERYALGRYALDKIHVPTLPSPWILVRACGCMSSLQSSLQQELSTVDAGGCGSGAGI